MKIFRIMINYISIIFMLVFSSSCDSTSINNIRNAKFKTQDSLIGNIQTINNDIAIVKVTKGSILNSGNQVTVDLSVEEEITFEVSDKVEVGFTGEVREIGPPVGIDTIYVKVIDN
ncbi:hypothetical protein [Oceanobacillus kimchii]|uniref:DUF3221 domain-containing protein n=2 Tax=Oceanobacillus kimchii TaxID=746691 RepID=A0ABQ5TJ96_9BACI|nr:hypothetical protein [Oceanobacillus kimchii]GLO65713.1 hypothetical protein MACH08_14970 [Oceanobacillus kimchii]